MTPTEIVRSWWAAIDSGAYATAADLLAPNTPVDWPLTGERLPSPETWKLVNDHYPSRAPWRATIVDLLADGDRVVTFTQVTDGHICDLAISHFVVRNDLIVQLVEYWPETHAAPTWRAGWSEPLPELGTLLGTHTGGLM